MTKPITDLKTNLAAIRFALELDLRKKLNAVDALEKMLAPQEPVTLEPSDAPSPSPAVEDPQPATIKPRIKPHVLEVARKLREPFTRHDLAQSVGLPDKDADNFIQRWRKKGWLFNVAFGKWSRTSTFGIEDTPSVRGQSMLKTIHEEIAAKKSEAT